VRRLSAGCSSWVLACREWVHGSIGQCKGKGKPGLQVCSVPSSLFDSLPGPWGMDWAAIMYWL
jgi:hypothetical protein